MKKKIAIFALVAIFVSVGSLTAQTKSVTTTKTTTVVKVDKKSATPACCTDKKSKCCKGKTAAQKAECVKKCNKVTAKTGTKTCTQTKKAVTKKI